jgi:mono/diheme cytochrome c family protein
MICAVACATLSCLATAAQQTQHDGAAERGRRVYFRHGCYGCHGFNGETGVRRLVGSPLLGKPNIFIAYLRSRADIKPLLPSTTMPSFSASALSDADALDLYAYIRSFVLHAPDPQGIAAFQKILESAKRTYKPVSGQSPP